MKLLFLFLLITFTRAEKLEKVKGTSGAFSDLVIDSKGRWYIVKDKKLSTCLLTSNENISCQRINLPSKKSVHKGLGIDQFDNIYVQDNALKIFIVTPLLNGTFVFDNVTNYHNKKLVSRPFALGENIVHFAIDKQLMHLKNGEEYTSNIEIPFYSKKKITNWIRSNNTRFGSEYEYTYFSIGTPRHWVYIKYGHFIKPVAQMLSFVKKMNAMDDHIYCIVNGEKQVKLIYFRDTMYISTAMNKESSYVTTIDGIDLSNVDIDDDFLLYSPEHKKTYIYGNINNKGIVYKLNEEVIEGKFKTKVIAEYNFDNNVRILCGANGNNKFYFGTTDGVYEMKVEML
ncbi:uncharacterized protein LOC127282800 [Leptopilina boulardi]|uniref:uncharacterized protein LOC127282800 n=1 Tax=Leptopilina boulardi TaxID=63433 RepID=UPI0021F5E39E|nr:uncharacterized protein LOC127282800 [Leptopilina boulardi]